MFRRTKYHIPFPDNELIYLSDLMLRWPFECYLKICFELFKKRLCMYVVTESYRSEDGEVKNIIMRFPTSSLSYDFATKSFNAFAFKREQVEKIEKKNKEYTYAPASDLITQEFHLCTVRNINRLAAQLAYAICLTSHTRYYKEFDPDNVLNAVYGANYAPLIYWGKEKKSEWQVTDDNLWSNNRTRPKDSRKEEKDLDPVRAFIQKKREQGVTSKKEIARAIDIFFPDFLSNQELGELLPARGKKKGATIKFESQRKQGYRLRKVT